VTGTGAATENERRERYERVYAQYREAARVFQEAEARRAPISELTRLQGRMRLYRVMLTAWRRARR
jgi:hypothetical protein